MSPLLNPGENSIFPMQPFPDPNEASIVLDFTLNCDTICMLELVKPAIIIFSSYASEKNFPFQCQIFFMWRKPALWLVLDILFSILKHEI